MAFNIHNRSLLSLMHHSERELQYLLDLSRDLKRAKYSGTERQHLKGKNIALIFEKPSTRTRVSFDVGVRQMGGQTMVLSGADMQLGHGETIADTARAGDVVICMGAGSIGGVPAKVVELLKD